MSDFVLDASLALRWFLEDEADRAYALSVLTRLSGKSALVPALWFYEVGNGLLMAVRRNRISLEQMEGFLTRLKVLPIELAQQTQSEILRLPAVAQSWKLTNYDAAYVALCIQFTLPLATTDIDLRKAAAAAGVGML